MIKLKEIIKEGKYWENRKFGESLPTLKLEQDEPDHFGGGENIDIFGFETKHFDICKSAVILYEKLKENEEAKELIVSSAKELDHLFEMEKQVVNGEEVDHDPIEHSVELVNIINQFNINDFTMRIGGTPSIKTKVLVKYCGTH